MVRQAHHERNSPAATALVVVSGLPCVGKSPLAVPVARELGLTLFEIDRIEAPLLRRGISGDAIGWAGYEIPTALAEDNLDIGRGVLLDSVCWTSDLRLRWQALATRYHAAPRPIEVNCSDLAVHRAQVEARDRSQRGLMSINWESVDEARSLYEPWNLPRLVLDSTGPPGALVRESIAYVRE